MQQHKIILENKQISLLKWLKIGVWAYILLLIFEGALRKWFLPFLSTPLLVVRDPIALLLIFFSWKHRYLPFSPYVAGMVFVGFIGIVTALVFGHGSIPVAIFGARILMLHFPFMFVMMGVLSREDVSRIGKFVLWVTLPMAVLIALQFYSPQSAWVNRGVGGDIGGAGFSGAMGYFRPSATFSFTNGSTMFFSLSACFIFYFLVSSEKISKFLLIGSVVALIASIPLSISRSLFFSIGLTIIFTLIAVSQKKQYFARILGSLIILAVLIGVLSQMAFFKTATEAFTSRFENASKVEGGVSTSLVDRFFGGMTDAISSDSNESSFFGYGIGMGTNVGSSLLTGKQGFLIAEEEWPRIVGEMGFVLGLMVIIIRLGFCISITLKSFYKLKQGDLLPWLLLSFALVIISQGQWAQPTTLGFSTVVGGLVLACLSEKKIENSI
jgi:hypothetical protein